MAPRVVIITTGGTIAMRHDESRGGAVPAVSGEELIAAVPALRGVAELELLEFSNLPSFHMTPATMLDLSHRVEETLAREDVCGVVITHGTDTMEETTYFIDMRLAPEKPVCFTGAMRSASDVSPDGPGNMYGAVRAASSPALRGFGAVVVMNEEIHAADQVMKMHRSAVHTFASPNTGALGRVDRDGVWMRCPPPVKTRLNPHGPLANVPLLKAYTGIDPGVLDALLQSAPDGLVIEGFGLGNLPASFVPGLKRALAAGMPVVITSRVPVGAVRGDYAADGGAGQLVALGAIPGGELSSHKARLCLMLALGLTRDREKLAALFAPAGRRQAERGCI